MVTSKNLPLGIEKIIRDKVDFWLGQEQQKMLVSLENIHKGLLPLLRSIKEVQEWQLESQPGGVSQVPLNDIDLVVYTTSFVVEQCQKNGILHNIAPIVKIPIQGW
jgi:hypothetical protein